MIVYTDGSASLDKKFGGWAYWIDESYKGSGGSRGFILSTTMEMLATTIALKRLLKDGRANEEITVKTDCLTTVNYLIGKWEPIKSGIKIYQRMTKVALMFPNINFEWIAKGSEIGNLHVNSMCRARRREMQNGYCGRELQMAAR